MDVTPLANQKYSHADFVTRKWGMVREAEMWNSEGGQSSD